MNENIHRVRQDLETISSAAGFGQAPLGREDIRAFRLLGGAGALWTFWAWAAGGLPLQLFTLFALGLSAVAVAAYHGKYHRTGERTATRDRVYRGSWRLGAILGMLIGGFYLWAKFSADLKGATFLGATFLFSGGLLVILAITDRWRLFFWGWAIPMLCFGALASAVPEASVVPLLGVVIGVGGFASAAIVSWQLRSAKA